MDRKTRQIDSLGYSDGVSARRTSETFARSSRSFLPTQIALAARRIASIVAKLHLRRFSFLLSLLVAALASNVLHANNGNAVGAPAENAAATTGGFWTVVLSGGIFGTIILLLLVILSMVAVYLIVEQLTTLRRSEVMPKGMGEQVRQLLAQGKLHEAGELCQKKPSPLSFVLLSGLTEMDFGWSAMEKAMEDAVSEQAAKLYRKTEYLSVIGNLAPMCGLLGTVTGMIFAFQQVAVSQGSAGAADLAEGIYSALVTTVGGLIVAIPSLGAFAVLRNRIDQLIAETAYMAQHVFSPVRRRATQAMSRSSQAPGTGSGNVPPPRPRSS